MSALDIRAALSIAACVAVVGVLQFLVITLRRERVKNDMREKLFEPLSVRWAPFGWWWGWYSGAWCSFFKVRYADLDGFIHEARCATGGSSPGVLWRQDEVIGRDESKSAA